MLRTVSTLVIAMAGCLGLAANPAQAAGPVETSIFAVQGIDIDVTDKDAASAKQKALVDVQVKAFRALAGRQGSARLSEDVAAFEPKTIMPYLKSLSVEEESVAPGRYIGKFTVRFLPEKVKEFYQRYGIEVPDDQGPPLLLIPVWEENGQIALWQDNPWRTAWQFLKAEQSPVPIIVALGDAEDQKILKPEDVLANEPVKMEAIRRRYDVKYIVIAHASPSVTQGIAVKIDGETAIGRVRIDKTYGADAPSVQEAANQAVSRFQGLMEDKYRRDQAKLAAAKQAERDANSNTPKSLPAAVPFSSPSQWNAIRARILQIPGVVGVDVSTLGTDGAVIRLLYRGDEDSLVGSFQAAGLNFVRVGNTWVIEAG
jgi:hypothetical protein